MSRVSSLSLYIDGYKNDNASFRDILSISYVLSNYLFTKLMNKNDVNYYREHRMGGVEAVTNDGEDYDKQVGVINFYTDGIVPNKIDFFVNEMVKYLQSNGCRVGGVRKERSRMYESDVVRIPILENERGVKWVTEDKAPEINLANLNAFFLFNKVLGYNKDLWSDSYFDIGELSKRVRYYLGDKKLPEGDYAGQPYISVDKGLDIFNGKVEGEEWKGDDVKFLAGYSGSEGVSNYDEGRVREKLMEIGELCDWAAERGYKSLYMV